MLAGRRAFARYLWCCCVIVVLVLPLLCHLPLLFCALAMSDALHHHQSDQSLTRNYFDFLVPPKVKILQHLATPPLVSNCSRTSLQCLVSSTEVPLSQVTVWWVFKGENALQFPSVHQSKQTPNQWKLSLDCPTLEHSGSWFCNAAPVNETHRAYTKEAVIQVFSKSCVFSPLLSANRPPNRPPLVAEIECLIGAKGCHGSVMSRLALSMPRLNDAFRQRPHRFMALCTGILPT